MRILRCTLGLWIAFSLAGLGRQAHGQGALTITGISPNSGPIGSEVTITGLNFGTSQGASTVSLNGTAAAVTSWTNTSIGVVVPPAATSGPLSVTVDNETASSAAFTITSLAANWSDNDVGSVGLAGSATFANGTFTVQGAGSLPFSGTSDAFHFVYEPLSGDGTIVARVVSRTNSSTNAGVMIRESLTAGSTYAAAAYESYNYFQYRTTTGATSSYQNSATVNLPYWLKLVRSGNTFTSYASSDSVNWTQVGTTQTITMATNVYIGLEVTSNNSSVLATATFDNVSISTPLAPPPVITSVSATTGPVGTRVVINGSGFGASQDGSVVMLNGAPVTINSWSATTISVLIPSGATSGPMLVSVAPSMNDSNYVIFTITSQPLPGGWLDGDIGSVGPAGSATFSNGTFTVQGAGNLPFSGTSDAFHFVYQPLSGDGTIVARVVSRTNSLTNAGVMIRETLVAGSTYVATTYLSYVYLQYRATTGGTSAYQYISPVNLPCWVKLVRSGNTFSSYASPDGVNWTQVGSQTTTMATNVDIGLVVSSGNSGSLATATFDNVSVSTPSAPAPVITSVSATTGLVGSQVVITGSGFGDSQNGSAVMLNGVPVTIDYWSATGIDITIPSGATSGPMLVSVAPSMNDSNYVIFTVTTQPLPGGWLDADIGSVGLAGSASYAGGTFTVKAAGNWPFSGTSDALHFVYQPLLGDGTIVARVVSASTSSTRVAVAIRETLGSGATYAAAAQQGYLYFQYRTTTSGSSSYQYASTVTLPYWVKLVRTGNTFTSYASPDGVNWTQVGTSQAVTMATNVYIGLGASSDNTGSLSTITFDNVSVSTPLVPGPVITSLSSTTGPVGSQVIIEGSGFGSSQNNSVVTLSGMSLPINSWSATSILVSIPSGATSGPMLVSVAPSMNDSNYVIFTVTSQPLPTGWSDADIGSVGLAGSATFSNGIFSVSGAGIWSFQGTSDAMHFVYQTLSGDGSIVARVLSRTTNTTVAGIMVRETLQASSTFAATTYDTYPYFQYRATNGAYSAYQNLPTVNLPYWVKLVRSGNTFSSYISPDGVTWAQVGTSQTITMASDVRIALVVTSESTSTLATATFDNVVITSEMLLPTVTGISPSSGPANTSVTVYGASFGATQGSSTLTFDGAPPASITSWGNNQIVATVPTTVRTGPVIVTVNSVQSNSNVVFTAFNPTITSLSPPAAPVGGIVTINGYGFGGLRGAVSVNGVQAGILNTWSDTTITFTVPQGATSGPVTVTMNGVTSNAVQLSIIEALSITGISPTQGEVGSSVIIAGTGFGPSQSDSLVAFDGVTAATTNWTDTQIVAVIPQEASTGQVTVEVAGVTATGPMFTVTSAIVLTDSLGRQSNYTSVIAGGKWYVSDSQGSGCSSCTLRGNITNQYDGLGNVTLTTDELGHVTSYTFDANNNLTQMTQPAVSGGTPTTTHTYNSFGEVLTMTDPLGHVTTNTYDSHGNLLTATTPPPNGNTAASVAQFAYNSLGELTQITDPLGHTTTIAYTPAGYIASITDPQSNVTSYTYDARGNRTSVTDALGHQTTFTYDMGNRLTQITYPDSTTTTFTYDYRGRRTSVTDQNGRTTSYAYDDADRLTSVTDAANNVTQYSYDTENNLLSITDANGHVTNFTYDEFGRVTQTTFPSNLFETYQYDADNNLTRKTDRKNQTIQYVYDALNRLTQKTYPDASSVDYVYDLVGKVQQVNDPTGTYGFAYDNMGRLIGTATQYSFLTGTLTNSYIYDAGSNRTGFTAPDGSTNTYTYDTLNRLSTLANSWAGPFGFSYDALSRRTQMTRPNNVTTNYSYDNLSRLLSVLHQAGGTIDGAVYTVDAAGNRTSKADQLAGVTTNYGYDQIYQLLSGTQGGNTTESYTYDPVGNRLSSLGVSPYSYNPSNEMVSTPTAMFVYDSDGNLTSKTDSNGTTSYTWDYENRLTQVTLPGSGGTVSFKYDPFGRRIYKSSSAGTSIFGYDGDNLIEEVNATGAVVARYTQGQNIDEPLAMYRSGATSYYEQDGLSSVTSLTNGAGALAQTYTFDSFGKTTNATGSLTNPFQYTAREFDSETGLYYYRARYYDLSSGRFLSEDPIGFYGGKNFYRYSKSDPVNLRDPDGKNAGTLALEAGEGLGGLICFGSGVCETVLTAGGVALGVAATGYAVYNWYESRSRRKSDPIPRPANVDPGTCRKQPGKCNPCPPDSPYWEQAGNAHGSTTGVHYHWYRWNQLPYPLCTCIPDRMSGPTPPPGGTPWSAGGAPWP